MVSVAHLGYLFSAGHFFVRSQDLLSLPNVSPDNGYGFLLSLEEDLPEGQPTCYFQIALLYTSAMGERRIRVHTLGWSPPPVFRLSGVPWLCLCYCYCYAAHRQISAGGGCTSPTFATGCSSARRETCHSAADSMRGLVQ